MKNEADRRIRLFVDFDGTITDKDIGFTIFNKFLPSELIEGSWYRNILDEWKAGRISSQECLTLECENSVVTQDELNAELDRFALTSGFVETVHYCRKNRIPIMILSDGLDYYIEFILAKYGINDVMVRANHMFFNNGSLGVDFPHMDKGCGRCGNCKRWHMDNFSKEGDLVIYTGDGFSDRFAIRSAGIIFARSDLAEFCGKEGISHIPFETFYDIIKHIEEIHGEI
ncbi:MtnX-like HAD-IB family phosphatase [Candidatus Latescibacterota bacterium]